MAEADCLPAPERGAGCMLARREPALHRGRGRAGSLSRRQRRAPAAAAAAAAAGSVHGAPQPGPGDYAGTAFIPCRLPMPPEIMLRSRHMHGPAASLPDDATLVAGCTAQRAVALLHGVQVLQRSTQVLCLCKSGTVSPDQGVEGSGVLKDAGAVPAQAQPWEPRSSRLQMAGPRMECPSTCTRSRATPSTTADIGAAGQYRHIYTCPSLTRPRLSATAGRASQGVNKTR